MYILCVYVVFIHVLCNLYENLCRIYVAYMQIYVNFTQFYAVFMHFKQFYAILNAVFIFMHLAFC
jgi:hypothetical protein